MLEKPVVAVTMGDPCGVGPEVVAKALGRPDVLLTCRPLVIGNTEVFRNALVLVGNTVCAREVASPEEACFSAGIVNVLDPHNMQANDLPIGKVSSASGKASVEWVLEAGRLAMNRRVDAIASAPINKEAASAAGYSEVGHMELLQRISGARRVATMLLAGKLRVVHLTTHRSMRLACDEVTTENVLAKIHLTNRFFANHGFEAPNIAVAALNPHASDGGLLGDEEAREISPAVKQARLDGIKVIGPVPADTVFSQAVQGMYDVVLAMYHDQGHVAVKVHDWQHSISVTIGLPFVRTSADHGTAFDIAWQGIAHSESMAESIKVAASLAAHYRLPL